MIVLFIFKIYFKGISEFQYFNRYEYLNSVDSKMQSYFLKYSYKYIKIFFHSVEISMPNSIKEVNLCSECGEWCWIFKGACGSILDVHICKGWRHVNTKSSGMHQFYWWSRWVSASAWKLLVRVWQCWLALFSPELRRPYSVARQEHQDLTVSLVLAREAVAAPSLEVFVAGLDGALSNLV